MGVLGFALFLLLILSPIVWYFKTRVEDRSLKAKLLAATLFGFLAVFFFDFPKERIEHQLYLALLIALMWIETGSSNKRSIGFGLPVAAPLIGLIALLLWNGYSGYQRYDADKYVNAIFQANERAQWKKMAVLTKMSKNSFYNIDPISNPIDWFAGVAEFQQGREKKAEVFFKRALEAHPNNHKVFNSLAGVYNRTKDYPNAIKYYEKALALNPFYDNAILNLAITYYQSGNFTKAQELVDRSTTESKLKTDLIAAIKGAINQ